MRPCCPHLILLRIRLRIYMRCAVQVKYCEEALQWLQRKAEPVQDLQAVLTAVQESLTKRAQQTQLRFRSAAMLTVMKSGLSMAHAEGKPDAVEASGLAS